MSVRRNNPNIVISGTHLWLRKQKPQKLGNKIKQNFCTSINHTELVLTIGMIGGVKCEESTKEKESHRCNTSIRILCFVLYMYLWFGISCKFDVVTWIHDGLLHPPWTIITACTFLPALIFSTKSLSSGMPSMCSFKTSLVYPTTA